tara:strand:+ start:86 stop:901 length:816 start_codon:yes stop_codon:yes gene_type:complete
MKLKHNKKRNTAFLYEVLVRHLTKSVLEKDTNKKAVVTGIIKEHFRKSTTLKRELEVYRAISDQKSLDYHLAEKLIFEAKRTYSKINKESIFKEQSDLIKKINTQLGKQAYSVFVPNYKNLASIYQILQDQLPLKSKMILEEGFVRKLASNRPKIENEMRPVSSIVYKTFVRKFNDQYGDSLLQEQIYLLSKYITSFADGGADFKVYLNEEVGRLRTQVRLMSEREDIADDSLTHGKIQKILETMDTFNDKVVDKLMIEQVLKIQKLVKEF